METYQIQILPTAQKELASLPKVIRVRIGKKIDLLQTNPAPCYLGPPAWYVLSAPYLFIFDKSKFLYFTDKYRNRRPM